MAKSTRRPQQIFSVVMWVLSVIFAGFLMGLGGLIIKDLPSVDKSLNAEMIMDAKALEGLRSQQSTLQSQMLPLNRASEDAQTFERSARADFRSAKSNFDNWISTRTATENAATNPEVLRRTRDLDVLEAKAREAERKVADARSALREQERKIADVRKNIQTLRTDAMPQYNRSVRARDLRVFGFRLLLTLPLLLAAAWMIVKKRKSAYWPLYRGFVMFSLFAFFVELVPYLPSYGGYVRYSVGILTVAVAGYFLIKQMRKYLARKQLEEAKSEEVRRKSIDYETALKKIAAKTCPGCDRAIVSCDGVHTDYCVHCGIHLQRECPSCETRNVTFYRYCLCCGTENEELVKPGSIQDATA